MQCSANRDYMRSVRSLFEFPVCYINHIAIDVWLCELPHDMIELAPFVYLFVCWGPQPHFSHGVNSRGRTYGDHPYHPGHSSPPDLVPLSVPSPPVLLSCILHQVRTLPCPHHIKTYQLEVKERVRSSRLNTHVYYIFSQRNHHCSIQFKRADQRVMPSI